MASALGYKVTELERTRIGKMKLKKLSPGEIRNFEKDELEIKITYGGYL
jgi:16S rRNA U516 pseudouridylate synthase RsuA-like enzyme